MIKNLVMKRVVLLVVVFMFVFGASCFAANDLKMVTDIRDMQDNIVDVKLAIDTGKVTYKEYHEKSRKAIISIDKFNNTYSDSKFKSLRTDVVQVSLLYQYIDTVWKYSIEGTRNDIDGVDIMQRDFPNLEKLSSNYWARWDTVEVLKGLLDNVDTKVEFVDLDVKLLKVGK